MIIDTFDFHGNRERVRYLLDSSETRPLLNHREKAHITHILQQFIEPRNAESSNKRSYLQNPKHPIIEDLFDEHGYPDYSNSHSCDDILEHAVKCSQRLGDYLTALNEHAEQSAAADWNVITVPDSYSALHQECILRQFPLARSKTRLLWRSVAICIASMDKLELHGAREGARVAVIDIFDHHYTISILSLAKDGDTLVPRRSVYKESRSDRYHCIHRPRFMGHFTSYDSEADEFYCRTYQNGVGSYVVYTATGFQHREFHPVRKESLTLEHLLLKNIDYCIINGHDRVAEIKHSPLITAKIIIGEGHELSRGAALFIWKSHLHAPTYFDECEELAIIVQNTKAQTIEAETLIAADSNCRGGDTIMGKANQSCALAAESDTASFYLIMGDISRSTKLKELTHQFPVMSERVQPLTLHPSMIPGQGIARVEVDAMPLLPNRVELDFLRMTESEKSMDSLAEGMELAFPVDFPEVESCPKKWAKVRQEICTYLTTRDFKSEMGGLFAKSDQKLGPAATGMDALQLINVFGTNSMPAEDDGFFEQLFENLANDYEVFKRRQDTRLDSLIRLIAWTYQCDDPHISRIAQSCLNDMRQSETIKPQYHTLASCCLASHRERWVYVRLFLKQACRQVEDAGIDPNLYFCSPYVRMVAPYKRLAKIERVDNWIRSMARIFMSYSDFFKDCREEDCSKLAHYLFIILQSYYENDKNEQYVNCVIRCYIFLLKRRRYDSSFIRDENGVLYTAMSELLNKINSSFSSVLLNFLQGKGSINGLPALMDTDS